MQKSNIADVTIRIRFRIPADHRLGVDETRVAFTPAAGPEVILMSADQGKTIRESDWLILQSSGWGSEEAAEAAAEPLMDALRRALARHGLGADLGHRARHGGGFSQAALEEMEKRGGHPILNDAHGPMVFATGLRPLFGRIEGHGEWPPVRGESWRKTFLFALDSRVSLSDRERTAFDLFSAAHSVGDSADARFALLFAAIEALLEYRPRPKPVVDHVDQLIAFTSATDLDKAEKDSLLGSLKWMRSHSIRSSGRRFVRERLADRRYQDRSAEELFLACYNLRNRLLHGGQPFPTSEEVSRLVGALDEMVSHLLAGPILDFDTA